MKEKQKNKDFTVIFKELETPENQKILQLTEDVKAVVVQVEKQTDALKKIADISMNEKPVILSTGV